MNAKTLARVAMGGLCLVAFGAPALLGGDPAVMALGLPALAAMEFFIRDL